MVCLVFPGEGLHRIDPKTAWPEIKKRAAFQADKPPRDVRTNVTNSDRKIVAAAVPNYLYINE
jgi:hypothetical protein